MMLQFDYGVYERRPLYFSQLELTDLEKYNLIRTFEQLYGDTDQDTEAFAFELLIVIRGIFGGEVVLNPEMLLLKDCLDEIKGLMPKEEWMKYCKDYETVKDQEEKYDIGI